MNIQKLHSKKYSELQIELQILLKKQFKLQLLKNSKELKKNHNIKQTRRDIARILTLLTEKKQKTNKERKVNSELE